VENVIEMHDLWVDVLVELEGDTLYSSLFEQAYGSPCIDKERSRKAIAQFIRSMVSFNSKYDRAQYGPETFTPLEQLGLDIWNDEGGSPPQVPLGQEGADCFHCHSLATEIFTDNQFHNNGLDSVFSDLGQGGVTGNPAQYGRFKTPSLRNIEYTAPYMHDGRFETLEEVVEHYNSGGHPSATVDPFMKFTVGGLQLSDQKKAALVAFMKTLSDEEFINNPDFQDPF
jgi:cytochrome c peroxidase